MSLVTNYSSRVAKIKGFLKRKGIDGFLVTEINNIRYLTGFTGSSSLLLITKRESIFVTDFRYGKQAEREVRDWDIIIEKKGMIKAIKDLSRRIGIKKLGLESSVSYEFFRRLSEDLSLKAFKGLIERLREIKDAIEINSIREAVRRAEITFLEVRPYIKQGVRERAIALRLEERLKKKGCRHIPFDVIVASGPNSAMPHARPTERILNKGDLIIVDWGGEADGYFSDMSRTLLICKGDNINKKKEIYQLVLEANKRAISLVSPGVESREVDSFARNVVRKAGYGEFFGHGTGHGVGLQVHELPSITRNKREVIKENMVFTIEPGIYVPGLGGVRIEDMVMVKPDGPAVLTTLPKELDIMR
ncbi:MAG: Xaa-Pro peptidase family protein [Thermodesulfovibrionales bacterium]|nr:Xaa-Pro peptidase family protein [Thermodesulfovibrionales bacterium]